MIRNYTLLSSRLTSCLKMWNTSSVGSPPSSGSIKNRTSVQWFASLLFLLLGFSNYGQTTLISPTGDGGFENGATLAANNWTAVNSTTDSWIAGSTPVVSAGTRCAFVSSTATGAQTWTYSQISTIQHLYYDVTIPAGQTVVTLAFKWKANGEGSTTSDWDNLKVFWGTTANIGVPVANTALSATFQVSGTGATSGMYKLSSAAYNNETITVSGIAGATYRLVFSWKSDSSTISNPPASIDEVNMVANAPAAFTAVQGGLWSSAATWGGSVPGAGNDVTIPAGMIVTVDQVTSYRNLTIGGRVQWNGTANAMTLGGNLTINSGGVFLPYSTVATPVGVAITVGGNFTNNGFANLATANSGLTFNGSGSTLGGSGTFVGDGTNGFIRSLLFSNTGSNAVTTTQNLIVTNTLAQSAGSLNTNGKLTLDNTAQVYGLAFNTSVASVAVTAMGSLYSVSPIVFGVACTRWTSGGASASNIRYVSGGNVYLGTSTAGLGTVAPIHTSGLGGTNSNLLWLGTVGTLGTPWPYNVAPSIGTQYFYGGNLYVATAATAATTPPTHTSGLTGSYLYVGTVATASVNYDATTLTVRSLNLTSAGSGYSSAPSVAFTVGVAAGAGSGAAASSAVFQQIAGPASFSMQKGGGNATFSGGLTINSDQGAFTSGNPQSSSGVGSVFTSNGGVNYTAAPTVGFSGPTALNLITNPGSGYVTAPTITLSGGTLVSGAALTSANFTITVNNGVVESVYLTGTATYSVPPTLALTASPGVTATLEFPLGCWPSATANIGTNGQLTSFTMSKAGFGYVAAPTVGLLGGTSTIVATAPTARVALYNLTTNFFAPAATPAVGLDDASIPTNRKINTLTLAGAGLGQNLSSGLTLYGTTPLSLTASANGTGNILDMGGNTVTCTWNGFAGLSSTFGASNTFIRNGSFKLTGRGGASTFNFPFSGTVSWFAGSTPTVTTTGSSVTVVTVSDTATPTNASVGTGLAVGNRAFRVQYPSGTTGLTPTVTLNFNGQDGLSGTQDQLLISESSALSGPWTVRSVASLTGVIPATGSRTTATATPGPIVPTGNNFYAWSNSVPTIINVLPLTVCANSGTFTLTGTSLTGVTAVAIGGTAVTSFVVVNETTITGVAGAGTTGFISIVKNSTTYTGIETITVAPSPTAPAVAPATVTVNLGGTVNLTASGGAGTFNWYNVAAGGTPIFTGATYTAPVCATTILYVAENNGSCEGARTAVPVTVTPTLIAATPATFCGTGGTVTLNVTPIDGSITYAWTNLTPSATLLSNTGNSVTATVTENSDFTVTATGPAGCSATASFSVSVYPLPTATVTTTANGVCPGTSATINSGLSAGNFTVTSTPYVAFTVPPSAVTVITNGVANVPLTGGSLDDGGWSGLPIGFNFNFFGNSFSTISAGTNGLLMFGTPPGYGTGAGQLGQFTFTTAPAVFPNAANPGNVIALMAADQYFGSGLAGSASSTLKYWTQGIAPNRIFVIEYSDVDGCCSNLGTGFTAQARLYETIGRVDVAIISKSDARASTVGLQNDLKTIGAVAPGRQAFTSLITTPETWRFSPPSNYTTVWTADTGSGPVTIASGTNIFSQTVSPAVTTTYSIAYTNQTTGCSNAPGSAQVVMSVLGTAAPTGVNTLASLTSVCLNGSTNLSLDYAGSLDGLTFQWQQDTGSGYTDIAAATAATYTATPSGVTSYRCVITSCASVAGQSTSTPVTITYTNTIANTTPATRCGTGQVNLSATTLSPGASIVWYAGASGGTALFTGATYQPTVSATTTYYVAAETTGPACSSPRVAVTATYLAPPAFALNAASAAICTGATSATFTDAAAGANYDTFVIAPTTGVASSNLSGVFSASFNPSVTTTYTITASKSGGSLCSISTQFTVTVDTPNATAAVNTAIVCSGTAVNLSVTSTALGAGPQTAPTGYCAGGGGTNNADDQIFGFSFGSLSNLAQGEACTSNYTDYSSTIAAPSVTVNDVVPFTVIANECDGATFYSNGLSIFIDYNRDGDFLDAGEQAYTTSTTTAAPSTRSGSITIPATASAGVTKMRVVIIEFVTSPGACDTYTYGETEDYNINIISSADATSTYTYSWTSTPAGFTASGATTTASPTVTTTYSVLATSPTGCSITKSVLVTVSGGSSITTGPVATQTRCLAGTAAFTVVASGVNPTYQWRKGSTNLTDGGTISGATSPTLTITGLVAGDAGNYNVVVSSDCGSPATSADAALTVVTPLAGISASQTTVCSGTTVTLTENGGSATSWSWSPGGATTNAISVTPTSTTNYVVTATTQVSGCTATANVTINVNETPSAVTVIPNNATVCSGAPVQLGASGGSFITTYFSDAFDSVSPQFTAATVSGTTTTSATLNTTYQSQGSGSVLFNTTGASSAATYSLNSNVNLTGATTATLTFSHIASMEGNFTSYDFGYVEYSSDGGTSWTTFTSANYSGAASNTVFSGSDVRFSTLSYTDWNTTLNSSSAVPNNSLWKTESFTVPAGAITSQFRLRFRYTTDSSANWLGWWIDNVKVNANGNTQYSWTATPATTLYTDVALTNAYNPATFAPTVYAQPTAQTQFTATVANGICSNSGSATVNVNALPAITLANSITVCKGTGATITIPENNNTYSWSPSTGITVLDIQSVLANPVSTQIYTVTTTNTSTFCQSTNQITVNVNDPGTIVTQPTNKIVATGFGTTYTVVGTTGITYGYQWQRKTGPSSYVNLANDSNYAGVSSSVLTVSNSGTGTAISGAIYRCLLTPPAPCADLSTNDVTLTVSSTGIASSPSDVNICLPTPTTAQFSVVTNGDPAYLVEWQVSTNNGLSYNTIALIDVDDTFLYIGPNTIAVPGLTFEHPLDSGNDTGSDYTILNVSGISNPGNLLFKAFVNESFPSGVATLAVSSPVGFATNLATTEIIRCKTPASAVASNLAIATSGTVTSVQWRYDTTPGGSFTNVVTNNTPAGATYAATAVGNAYSLDVTTNASTPAGSYYYKAFVLGSAACGLIPAESDMATITVVSPAVAISSSAASYCTPGAAVVLTASGATGYSWSSTPAGFTSTSTSVSVTPSVATIYTVEGTDSNGCTNTATFNVGVGSSFTVAATSASSTVCPSTSVQLNSTVVFSAPALIDPTTVGGFESGATFPLNGWTLLNGATNNWFVGTAAGVQAGTNAAFIGTGNVATGSASVNHFYRDIAIPAGSTNITLKFYMKMAIIDNTFDYLNVYTTTIANTPVAGTLPSAGYTTVLSYTTPALSAYTLRTFTLPNALAGTTVRLVFTYKSDGASPFSAPAVDNIELTTTPNNTLTYAWSTVPSSAFTAAVANPIVTPTATTSYNLTVTSNSGCSATLAVPLTVTVDSALPTFTTATPASQSLCSGTAVSFAVVGTSATPLTYVWKKNGVAIPSATNATLTGTTTTAASTASNFTSDTYTVDIIGCSTVTATFTLTVNPLPTATIAGTTSVCQNNASPLVTFTGATGSAPYTFTYKINGGTNQTVTTTSGNSVTVAVPTTTAGSFNYSLVSVQDANTCSQAQSGSAIIFVNAALTAATLSPVTTVCQGNTLNFNATVAPLSGYSMNVNSAVPFIDIDATGTSVGVIGDDTEHNLTIPSFTFNGVAYTTARVGNNGILAFGSTAGDINYSNIGLPAPLGFNGSGLMTNVAGSTLTAICALWDDLTPSSTLPSSIRTQTVGTKYIVQWTNEDSFSATGTGTITFQIQLDTANGQIHLVYPDVNFGAPGFDSAANATVGLNFSASSALQYSLNAASLVDGQSLTFTPATYSYAWSGPNGFSATVQNPSITNAQLAATGTYTLVLTNGNGCSATSTVGATVSAQPLWYLDADADGYYTGTSIVSCTSPGVGYTTTVTAGGDCNDSVFAI
ncbi:GEVED domain-containing protein, partial [Flavobacterium sp.]|uniref:beta strand repeat-containing protein n=1 Tax=Flavobacterium sp. TaxID=239 RepID=UPI00248A145B